MPAASDVLQVLTGRRSIRSYTSQDISEEHVTALLQAAMAAPSAVAKDPWRFIVAQKQETRDLIADGLKNGQMLRHAALAIVVCGDQAAAHGGEMSYMLQDCSAAIQNTLIAAHMLGLGAVWLGVHPRDDRVVHLRSVLGIPEEITPLAVVSIGHPAERKAPRTRFKSEYVHQEKW